jgi:hypothetical protein
VAIERAGLMFACYRRDDANEPEVYLAAVVSVLTRYPQTVVVTVTEPFSGLPSKQKFLPSIAEIKEACEAEMADIYRMQKRRDDMRAQSDRRREDEKLKRKRTPEEIEAEWQRMERVWGAPLRKPGEHGRPLREAPTAIQREIGMKGLANATGFDREKLEKMLEDIPDAPPDTWKKLGGKP